MNQEPEFADAVAVIGMSCRFAPDLDSPDKLWAFLVDGQSSVTEMPEKRWESYASTSPQATAILRRTTRLASFLDDIEGFDADFFGISPREADFLDPQQRIVLELAWEALTDAGVPPLSLRGSDAGVFVAANSNDYGRRLLEDIPRTGAWAVNGTTYYGIANRISYFLDLRGPSMAVDTACAGSLTALHVACQSLRTGESPVAIVGGVNIMASPTLFVALDAAGATAPDGRSKAFDKFADGYGRGEGAGVVVLKLLSEAQRDGDNVLALIRGSGVFQDGRSDGMMAPNGDAQEHMLLQTYERAGVAPSSVGYVEAHGTGTPVGDREEAQALAAVFGTGRPADEPCLVGSVKPNIGHVEAGSGIAGIIKAILALQHGEIPPSIHTEPNPDFSWESSGLRLVAQRTPWPAGEQPRRAGISSYGVGGSIAHTIVEEAPRVAEVARPERTAAEPVAAVYPLSTMSEGGLRALAATTADWLTAHPDGDLSSIGHTLAQRRSHLAQRAAVVAGSAGELATRLRMLADGQRSDGVYTARTTTDQAAGVVWVFSGHGSQWSGMGRQLLRDEPVFAAAIDELAEIYQSEMGWAPRDAIVAGGPWTSCQVQAMTFAMQYGLARVWRGHGVEPAAVIGHSVGEIAAAVAAGVLEPLEAARFACRRANALERLQGSGGMALVSMPFDEAQQRLAGRSDVVAAISASPGSTVISGDPQAVRALAAQWKEQDLAVWLVDTDIAFHSPQVNAAILEVSAAADAMTFRPARVPLYNTALTDPRSSADRDSDYWVANLRQPVRFAGAVEAAITDGHRLFLEISSHPVVTHSIRETLEHLDVEDATVTHSLRRDSDEVATLLGSLAELYCNGATVDWAREQPGDGLAALPNMAWQHRPYWIFPDTQADSGPGGGHDPEKHSLLGGRMTVSGAPPRQVWQTHLDMSSRPYPQDHQVVNVEITPAAVLINTFVAAAEQNGVIPALSEVVLRTPLAVAPPRVVQIVLSDNTVRLSTRIAAENGAASDDEANEWITHSTAVIDWGIDVPQGTVDAAAIRARSPEEWSWTRVDDMFRRMGVGGYAFAWDVEELRRNDREQLALLTIEPAPAERASSWAHVIDGALTISAVLVTPEYARHQWMSSLITSVAFEGDPPAQITVHSVRSAKSPEDTVDVLVADPTGKIVCEVKGLRFSAISDEYGSVAAPRDLVHEVAWTPLAFDAPKATTDLDQVVLVGAGTASLAGELELLGLTCRRVDTPEDLTSVSLTGNSAVLVAPALVLPDESTEQATERCSWTLVRAAQHLIELQKSAGDFNAPQPRLWCLTRGVKDGDREPSLAHAPLWGITRILAGEHPELHGGVIDIPTDDTDIAPQILSVLLNGAGQEDIISVTTQEITAARLAPITRPSDGAALQCRATDTYLVTGGLGALGLLIARWLADRGARRILLANRNGLPPRASWPEVRDQRTRRQIQGVLELETLGVTVKVLELDIADAEQAALKLDMSALGLPPIRGVVHAAGAVQDAMIDKVDLNGLKHVLASKVDGAMVLHRMFPPGSLDFMVFFSSCGQFARLTGQTSYAAGNSFLDALAAHRHTGGHTETTSLGWTSWRGVGMSETISTTMMEANSRGLDAVSADEAVRAWAFADRFSTPYQAILRVLPAGPNATRLPMFRGLTSTESSTGVADSDHFQLDWAGSSEADLRELVIADVREQVAAELNLDAGDVELKRPLVELGIDSVMTVALRMRLQRRYSLDLPPNILWNKPTVTALAGHLIDTLRPQEGEEPSADLVAAAS